jgi:hypothetical protein
MTKIEKDETIFHKLVEANGLFSVHELFEKEGEGYMISAFKTEELITLLEKCQMPPQDIPGKIRDKVAVLIFDSLKGITKNELGTAP